MWWLWQQHQEWQTPHPTVVSAARTNPVLHVLGWVEAKIGWDLANPPNSGEHAESTALSLPLWFFRPGSLTPPLQPSWKVQGCIKHIFTLWKQAVAVWNIFLQTSCISALALIVSFPAHIHLGWVRMSSVQLFWDAGAAVMVPWKKTPLLVVPSQHGGAKRAKIKGAKTGLCLGFACVATREMHSRERNHC